MTAEQIFVFQVDTGNESDIRTRLVRTALFERERLIYPRRRLIISKGGRKHPTEKPVFPGYLFYRDRQLTDGQHRELRRAPGVFRILPAWDNVLPLPENERRELLRLVSGGEVAGLSLASFDENQRIVILEGPLKGQEGRVVKVDRRQGRCRVRLSLYAESFLVDFSYRQLRPGEEPARRG